MAYKNTIQEGSDQRYYLNGWKHYYFWVFFVLLRLSYQKRKNRILVKKCPSFCFDMN